MPSAENNVIQLIRRGVTCLEEASRKTAFTYLRRALSTVLSEIEASGRRTDDDGYVSTDEIDVRAVPTARKREESGGTSPSLQYDPSLDVFSLYDRAFVPSHEDEFDNTTASNERLSVVVVYNIALTHHLGALYGDHIHRDANLKKALSLYMLAASLLDGGIGADSGNLLRLAVTNNMGHIHAHFFEAEQVSMCLRHMKSVLESTAYVNGTLVEEHVCFHTNVLLLFENAPPAAPMA